MRKPLFIAKQGRKPSGLLGQIVARVTAKETAGANEIALQLLQLQPDDAVLEIGSGHGEPWQSTISDPKPRSPNWQATPALKPSTSAGIPAAPCNSVTSA